MYLYYVFMLNVFILNSNKTYIICLNKIYYISIYLLYITSKET